MVTTTDQTPYILASAALVLSLVVARLTAPLSERELRKKYRPGSAELQAKLNGIRKRGLK